MVWVDINNYEGLYQVSSTGLVRNIKTGRVKKPTLTKSGYLRTQLSKKGNNKRFFIHRIVADAFLGLSELQVNHKNSNKVDNSVHNLEYTTSYENQAHRYRFKNKKRGVRQVGSKFRASIKIKNKYISLGTYNSEDKAYEAYYHYYYINYYGVAPWEC